MLLADSDASEAVLFADSCASVPELFALVLVLLAVADASVAGLFALVLVLFADSDASAVELFALAAVLLTDADVFNFFDATSSDFEVLFLLPVILLTLSPLIKLR